LEVALELKPIEIVYQAEPIENLTRFFKVKHLRDETKIAAMEQFEGLNKQVQAITKNIEADFKNNKVSIIVDAPTLVLPFD